MTNTLVVLKDHVRKEWIDYNGHMNDADYVRAFSWAVDGFMGEMGLNETFREKAQYTMFTLENHICYLAEMKFNEPLEVHAHVLDYDEKRVHLFLELYGAEGKRAATSEQMMMGIEQQSGRPGPFPEEISSKLKQLADEYAVETKPKEAGRVIGIRKKK
ncbi:thioesterase family protein [Halobacillus shinanisalinarum]|uniref:Thioesterase family protein n=1 Tax=Halobacillus shinanisalinarum TaxID=2932258 RepID=A0ABY4H4T4_9BACI|nr:thioesterase family protein [Halobacillus shinanisalinarum]UOQ95329.1 thioesterase family protein [Halobacillus shinanisalinarum]